MSDFHRTTTSFKQGSRTMPGEVYTSPQILAEEKERIHARTWNCVGRSSRIEQPGQYFVAQIAGESIIVLRDRKNALRAFFNVCRHRGTRICMESSGQFGETIQCPYHAWTYRTDGELIGAPHMQDVEDFEKSEYPLHAAAIAEWEGFLFVNIARDPEPFERAFSPMIGRFSRFGLPGLVPGYQVTYDVRANWKLVFQNYSECLHCPTIHPKLATVLPYQSGANDLVEGRFLGGYMEITPPNQSATMTGRMCGPLVSGALPEDDRHRGYYYTLMPNLLLSLHPDYVNYYLVHPVAPDHTRVESEWLFHPDTIADPNNNIRDGIEFWDLTNRQDWDIVERSQLGIASRRYAPGPYSARESIPAAWDRAYRELMGRA
ncbi:MAG TPA: aromatic ring-hydroxylating dioxygenase subunit alpha [Candidatus Eisenbacteria bacterium]|nr:aromatic ring-hydroxylating dioxygenase subunit alpha [Candidatus Eisenbacteria bacterium]